MPFSSPPPSPVIAMFEQLLPVFILVALFGILARNMRGRVSRRAREPRMAARSASPRFPSRFDPINEAQKRGFTRKRIFNSSEVKLLRLIRDELGNCPRKIHVMGQMSLPEIVQTDQRKKFGGNFFVIGNKRLDFVLVDDDANAVVAIEYHGGGHFGPDALKNDQVKAIILAKAGIPLLVVKENEPESSIRRSLRHLLGYSPSREPDLSPQTA